jgi:hypothetical protein
MGQGRVPLRACSKSLAGLLVCNSLGCGAVDSTAADGGEHSVLPNESHSDRPPDPPQPGMHDQHV